MSDLFGRRTGPTVAYKSSHVKISQCVKMSLELFLAESLKHTIWREAAEDAHGGLAKTSGNVARIIILVARKTT